MKFADILPRTCAHCGRAWVWARVLGGSKRIRLDVIAAPGKRRGWKLSQSPTGRRRSEYVAIARGDWSEGPDGYTTRHRCRGMFGVVAKASRVEATREFVFPWVSPLRPPKRGRVA
jgi:hypothetical protein